MSFLHNRKSLVSYKNYNSDIYVPVAGVPQGSILSPLLYTLYVSDIPTPNNCTITSFADDTIIHSSAILSNDIIHNLERGFHEVNLFFHRWKIPS